MSHIKWDKNVERGIGIVKKPNKWRNALALLANKTAAEVTNFQGLDPQGQDPPLTDKVRDNYLIAANP